MRVRKRSQRSDGVRQRRVHLDLFAWLLAMYRRVRRRDCHGVRAQLPHVSCPSRSHRDLLVRYLRFFMHYRFPR